MASTIRMGVNDCIAKAISSNFKRMLSVHLENGRVEVRKQPLPRVAKGFARIRMLAAGICSTDLELQRGYYGFSGTPGHEFVGETGRRHARRRAKSISPAAIATGARADWAGTAPTAPCWES